jgi:hypothetical protein
MMMMMMMMTTTTKMLIFKDKRHDEWNLKVLKSVEGRIEEKLITYKQKTKTSFVKSHEFGWLFCGCVVNYFYITVAKHKKVKIKASLNGTKTNPQLRINK